MPDYLKGVAEIGGDVNALPYHNPDATFTSRGCVRNCPFCAVPKIEGQLRELETWDRKPIVCDNNLLACSKSHFDKVVDSLKGLKQVDFNQGLDSRFLTPYHADRLAELDLSCLRLAWDNVKYEQSFMDAVAVLDKAGFKRDMIRTYVLIGFTDTPEDAHYRLETLREMGILPSVMRFHPLDSMYFHNYVGPHWTEEKLVRLCNYYSRIGYIGWVPFEDYNPRIKRQPPEQMSFEQISPKE
jgi:pyruvate-formate lyase-activating enzyme